MYLASNRKLLGFYILHLASAGDHSSSTGNIKLSTTIVLYMLV